MKKGIKKAKILSNVGYFTIDGDYVIYVECPYCGNVFSSYEDGKSNCNDCGKVMSIHSKNRV
jgi:PHP family Zn ribbon phosphoesterase